MIEVALAALALVALRYVVWPWARLEHRRRRSRMVKPAVGQVWVQDDALVWIADVNVTGVSCVTLHDGKLRRWEDSHASWAHRVNNRVLWFTGQTRALTESNP